MTLRMKAGLAVVAAVILAAGGLLSASVFNRQPKLDLTPHRAIQMQPDSSPEWTETLVPGQVTGKFGLSDQIAVQYRNGTHGTRYLRPDQKRWLEEIFNSRDFPLMHAEFADDGEQVVSGFRLRYCGTTLWNATPDAKKMVMTVTYWHDGKHIFSVQMRRVGSPNVDEIFFYLSGQKWMHFIGPADHQSAPGTAEVWNEKGVLVFSHYTGLNSTTMDTGYRDDGSKAYRQLWATKATPRAAGDNSPPDKLLLKGELYSPNDTLQREFIMSDDGFVLKRVVDHESDGKTRETMVYLGQATIIRDYDAKGNLVDTPNITHGQQAQQVLIDANLRESHVQEFDPLSIWLKQEDNPSVAPLCGAEAN